MQAGARTPRTSSSPCTAICSAASVAAASAALTCCTRILICSACSTREWTSGCSYMRAWPQWHPPPQLRWPAARATAFAWHGAASVHGWTFAYMGIHNHTCSWVAHSWCKGAKVRGLDQATYTGMMCSGFMCKSVPFLKSPAGNG
eukprot:1152168-Pelagomonas_calceolata.AAC.3